MHIISAKCSKMKFYKPKRSALKESNTITMNWKIYGCNNTNRDSVLQFIQTTNIDKLYSYSIQLKCAQCLFSHTAIYFRCFSFNKYIIYLTFLSCFLVFVVMKNCIGLTHCLSLSLTLLSLHQTTWIRKKICCLKPSSVNIVWSTWYAHENLILNRYRQQSDNRLYCIN